MRTDRYLKILALLLVSAPATGEIKIDQAPVRQFGYTIGDVVNQVLYLKPPPGQALVEDSLPGEGRANVWLERRRVDALLQQGRWRISLTYQFINSPTELRTVELPSIRVKLRAGEHTVETAASDATLLTLAPLASTGIQGGASLKEMRPDTPPPLIDVTLRLQRLVGYAVLAGLFGFLWAAWYIGFDLHGRRKRPFAKAEREIRLLFARDKSRDGWREAMRLLHRAFDTTDSAAVFGASLDTFFSRHSALSPARELVAEFFVASRSEFFGLGEVADDFDATRLLGLARRLKSLEREMA